MGSSSRVALILLSVQVESRGVEAAKGRVKKILTRCLIYGRTEMLIAARIVDRSSMFTKLIVLREGSV